MAKAFANPCVYSSIRHGIVSDTVRQTRFYPLREHVKSVQLIVSEEYCEGVFPAAACCLGEGLNINKLKTTPIPNKKVHIA